VAIGRLEQAGILDGLGGLVGEGLHQRRLRLAIGGGLAAVQRQVADNLPARDQRRAHPAAHVVRAAPALEARVGLRIGQDDGPAGLLYLLEKGVVRRVVLLQHLFQRGKAPSGDHVQALS